MRVLFLTDPVPDYLADLLYIGLSRVLGSESVIDFPSKATYHRPEHRVHYIPQLTPHSYQDEDIVASVREGKFDFAVVSSPRPGAMAALEALKRRVPMPPVILFDGEDDSAIREDAWKDSQAALYFKRELRLGAEHGLLGWWRNPIGTGRRQKRRDRLFPLQLSVALEQIPRVEPRERVVDISYAARISHPKRKQAVDVLRGASEIHFEGGVYAEPTDRRSKLTSGLPQLWNKLRGDPVIPLHERGTKLTSQMYYDLLMRSRMALSVRGGGFDTLRYWEIVATKTLLVSEQPDIEIPNNFLHGVHALFFKPDLSDLAGLVQAFAKEARACAAIAQRGYEHLLRHHTCERRAEFVLDTCRRML